MILKTLKSNRASQFLLVSLFIAGFWMRSILHPGVYPFFEGEDKMPLYQLFSMIPGNRALVGCVLSIVFVIFISFMILRLNTVHGLISARTFLPSTIFVFIAGGFVTLHTMHPVYAGILFFILCIDRVFKAYEERKLLSCAFDAGFFLGTGSLFYFCLVFYFPVIIIGLFLIHKRIEWRSFFLSLIGVLLPWLFLFSLYFMTDRQAELWPVIVQNVATPNPFFRATIYFQVYLLFLTLIMLVSSLFLLSEYGTQKINIRKYFKVFLLIFLFSVVILFSVPAVSQEILLILAVPLTFLISNYLILIRKQFWGNLILYIFLGAVIVLQFV